MDKNLNTKDSRMYGLMVLYDMHTDFLRRAVDGLTDEAAQSRLDTKANHVAWLLGSIVQERFELANRFGEKTQQTHYELFNNYQGIQDGREYPPFADFIEDWNRVSSLLKKLLVDLEAKNLDDEFEEMEMKMSYFDLISFIIYREANIIGQIALWRRLLGYPALKYD